MSFDEWLKEVDKEVIRLSGVSYQDLADQTWWDWWNDGYGAKEAAREALENEGFPFS